MSEKIDFQKVLVVCAGISGKAACQLLLDDGKEVILFDQNEEVLKNIDMKVTTLSQIDKSILSGVDLMVVSPGVPVDRGIVDELAGILQVPIWGEIELGFHYCKAPILGITGTNGKTTTTALLGEIMTKCGYHTRVGGNIGKAFCEYAHEISKEEVVVLELSSFQLETIHHFRPKVAALLNITPDHLDRHLTMDNYGKAKLRITENQQSEDVFILNLEDEGTRSFDISTHANVLYFSTKQKPKKGMYLKEGSLYYVDDGERKLLDVEDLQVLGLHNYENVMVASLMAISFGADFEQVAKACKAFKAVEHRIEYVGEYKGVKFYNDSKATNPDAAIKGIQAMERETILIGGGYDKDADYELWLEAARTKIKHLILMGATAPKILETASKLGIKKVSLVENMEEAFELILGLLTGKEAVLLSPACASWGMYKNFEERGHHFKAIVNELIKRG